jgi:hypothetical protein
MLRNKHSRGLYNYFPSNNPVATLQYFTKLAICFRGLIIMRGISFLFFFYPFKEY